jgi:hypothetical protein
LNLKKQRLTDAAGLSKETAALASTAEARRQFPKREETVCGRVARSGRRIQHKSPHRGGRAMPRWRPPLSATVPPRRPNIRPRARAIGAATVGNIGERNFSGVPTSIDERRSFCFGARRNNMLAMRRSALAPRSASRGRRMSHVARPRGRAPAPHRGFACGARDLRLAQR